MFGETYLKMGRKKEALAEDDECDALNAAY